MTKQSKTLIALAAVVVVCAAGYVGLRTWNQSQSEVDETVYITQLSDPTALTFTNQYGTYSFTKGRRAGPGTTTATSPPIRTLWTTWRARRVRWLQCCR